jgi:hypothetical protein
MVFLLIVVLCIFQVDLFLTSVAHDDDYFDVNESKWNEYKKVVKLADKKYFP